MLPKLSECGSSLPTHWLSEILLETPRRAERIYWSVITQWSPSASIWAVNMSGCFTMPQHATKMSVSNLVTSLAMGKDFKGECAVLSFVLSREKRWIFIWTRINLSFFTSPSAYNPCCAPFPRWTSLIQLSRTKKRWVARQPVACEHRRIFGSEIHLRSRASQP